MKTNCILSVMVILFLCSPICSADSSMTEIREILERQVDILDLSILEDDIANLDPQMDKYLPSTNLRDYIFLHGDNGISLDVRGFINAIINSLFAEVIISAKLLGHILILAVLYGILEQFYVALAPDNKNNLAYTVCVLTLIVLATNSLIMAINNGKEAIDNMVSFMLSLFPIMLGLLSAAGAITSTAVFSPLMLALITSIATVVKHMIVPLILLATGTGLVSTMSEHIHMNRMTGFIKQISMFMIALISTVFLGVTGIYGITLPVADGINIRFAKFVSSRFVPVVGNLLSEAAVLVAGGSIIIRNALGIVGLITIASMCLFPAIKILAAAFIYQIAAALIEPVAGSKFTEALGVISNSLIMIFASVLIVGLMFFFSLLILIGMGNMALMVR